MVLFLFLNLIFSNISTDKLISVKVTDDITMLIPSYFRPMTDEEIANKYFTIRRPVALYTDSNLLIDLGVNKSSTNWSSNDIEIMMSFQKSNIYNLFDEITMISEGVKEVNGRKAGFFEFESRIKGDKNSIKQKGSVRKYTYIQYLIVGQTSWIFNFTSPIQLKDKWQKSVTKIMGSIEIQEKR